MGDPKKRRKKYKLPATPWQKERIDEESEILKEYGLKNKKELWKMRSILSSFARQAKKSIAAATSQTGLEKKQLLNRLSSLGFMPVTAKIEDALVLDIRKILERRLQTLIFKKGLARTVRQARQFITHGHIAVEDKKITIPSYLVPESEENKISFIPVSSLASLEHPERFKEKPEQDKIKEKKETKSSKPKEKPAEEKKTLKESPTKEKKAKKEKPAKPKKQKEKKK